MDFLTLALSVASSSTIGQRDDAVEPVGDALPALGLAAEPGAVLDVGPELVEVPAQAGRLDPKLVLEPAGGLDAPQAATAQSARAAI